MTKGIKHKDIGEDLSRTEFEADDSHELETGTSFPGSPVEKDRFYRSDLHQWYIYNGTEWKQLGGYPYAIGDTKAFHATKVIGNYPDPYWKAHEWTLSAYWAGLTLRTTFEMKNDYAVNTSYARIYRNGVGYGTSRSTQSLTYIQYDEDLAPGACAFQLYQGASGTEQYGYCFTKNFGVNGSANLIDYAFQYCIP